MRRNAAGWQGVAAEVAASVTSAPSSGRSSTMACTSAKASMRPAPPAAVRGGRTEQREQALDQLVHLAHVVDRAARRRMRLQLRQPHAQARQRRAQVVRHRGQHQALGVEVALELARQLVEHARRLAHLARAALLVQLRRGHGDAHAGASATRTAPAAAPRRRRRIGCDSARAATQAASATAMNLIAASRPIDSHGGWRGSAVVGPALAGGQHRRRRGAAQQRMHRLADRRRVAPRRRRRRRPEHLERQQRADRERHQQQQEDAHEQRVEASCSFMGFNSGWRAARRRPRRWRRR